MSDGGIKRNQPPVKEVSEYFLRIIPHCRSHRSHLAMVYETGTKPCHHNSTKKNKCL